MTNEQIYKKIQDAILERRLLPGTKLAENRLAKATKANRMRIRQVLSRLAHEQIVTLIPNRGAYVAQPSVKEAQEMFETRRLIEPPLVEKLTRQISKSDIVRLKAHVDKEQNARKDQDFRKMVRLSGEFHVLLISMVANHIQLRLIKELTALTCLIIMLYDKPNAPACPQHEHEKLVKAIAKGEAENANQIMYDHLMHIEQTLDLTGNTTSSCEIESIFQD